MGALWKFFSGEDDAVPEPPARTSVWGFMTGQHAESRKSPRRVSRSSDRSIDYEGAAYHEAGHARAAAAGGFKVGGMWAFFDGSGLTRVEGKNNMSDRQRRAMLVALVAGQEAECRYLMDHHGYSYREALRVTHHGASDDRQIFAEGARGTGYTFENLRPEAHRLVRRQAYTIETNAKPLARRGHRGGTWA